VSELDFLARLRTIATAPGARGLLDDAAVLDVGGTSLVLTHDTLVEGVHFLPSDPAGDVAWKLVAVNLSDLAAKGARPLGALLSYTLRNDPAWDAAFIDGLRDAMQAFELPLLGGDTVAAGERVLGLSMFGEASGPVPSRGGARPGDALFVTGTIGDAALGLALARAGDASFPALIQCYRRPVPQIGAGRILAPMVGAMMDVSDGLLIDASRLAAASGCAAMIDLDAVPLSADALALGGSDRAARLAAATGGDDYQLLFATFRPLPPLPCPVTRIGQMVSGSGLRLHDAGGDVPLPDRLGWLHS
jgi:thiamine-monophosphate kinase